MKKVIAFVFLFISCHCIAQTAGEFLAQKKKRIEYLTKQVAALQVYIGYAQKGYAIAKNGLELIGDIKNGDLNLHAGYFNSLKKVNPKISEYARVADIMSCQVKMVKSYKSAFRRMKQSGQLTENEINYIYSVFTKLLDEAAEVITQLTILISPDGYEMKDNERLQRIDVLYNEMQDKQSFVQRFSNENLVLSMLRKKEKNEVEFSKSLNNIK